MYSLIGFSHYIADTHVQYFIWLIGLVLFVAELLLIIRDYINGCGLDIYILNLLFWVPSLETWHNGNSVLPLRSLAVDKKGLGQCVIYLLLKFVFSVSFSALVGVTAPAFSPPFSRDPLLEYLEQQDQPVSSG